MGENKGKKKDERKCGRKWIKRILIFALVLVVLFPIVAWTGVTIAYNRVFSRADYQNYNSDIFLCHNDVNVEYEKLSIPSAEVKKGGSSKINQLAAFLYGTENTKGLIIISPGHGDCSDIKLPEILYFAGQGWQVLCYDYTGCYGSEGNNMVGYMQAPADLDAVLTYVEQEKRFSGLPVFLFGHSLGAYATAAVLQEGHKIEAAVVASGFDDPMEQWGYSVKRFTGVFKNLLAPFAEFQMKWKFGELTHYSAIDGINSTNIPIYLLQGTTDEFYGEESSIYVHREQITNPNCTIRLMDADNHHGHYDYFLTDEALAYQKEVSDRKVKGNVDKFLYLEHDTQIMDDINAFYLKYL